jgi:hypothetical protein
MYNTITDLGSVQNGELPIIITEHFGLLYVSTVDFDNYAWYIQIPRGYTKLVDIEAYVDRYMKSGLPRIYREPHTLTR